MKPSRENEIFELYEWSQPPVLEVVMKTDSGWIEVEDEDSAEMLRDALEKLLERFRK